MLVWFLIILNLILNFITIIYGSFKNETFKDNVLYVLLLINFIMYHFPYFVNFAIRANAGQQKIAPDIRSDFFI